MNLLPYRSFDFSTLDSSDVVTERLRRVLESDEHAFRGRIDGKAFRFRRRGFLKNRLFPTLFGTIHSESNGTRIDVEMIPGPLVLTVVVFLYVMLSYLIFVANGPLVFLLTGIVIILSWLFLQAGLWMDSDRSRQILSTCLDIEP